jgi:hypothetical protein
MRRLRLRIPFEVRREGSGATPGPGPIRRPRCASGFSRKEPCACSWMSAGHNACVAKTREEDKKQECPGIFLSLDGYSKQFSNKRSLVGAVTLAHSVYLSLSATLNVLICEYKCALCCSWFIPRSLIPGGILVLLQVPKPFSVWS